LGLMRDRVLKNRKKAVSERDPAWLMKWQPSFRLHIPHTPSTHCTSQRRCSA
jgi:hypothetical protein